MYFIAVFIMNSYGYQTLKLHFSPLINNIDYIWKFETQISKLLFLVIVSNHFLIDMIWPSVIKGLVY